MEGCGGMTVSQRQELLEAMHKLKKASQFDVHNGELSRGECFLLQQISKRKDAPEDGAPGVRISDLSASARMSKPAVSQMLNVLEDKGMVRRITTKNDRRVVYVALTEDGKSVLSRFFQRADAMMDKLISRLGTEDTDLLIRLINRLYDILNEMRTEGK